MQTPDQTPLPTPAEGIDALAFLHAPVGIVLTSSRVIRAANHSFAQMTGHEPATLQGQSFRMFYDSDRAFRDTRDIGLQPLRDGQTYSDERLLRHATGRAILVRFHARTLTPDAPLANLVMSFTPLANPLTGDAPKPILTPRERTVVAGLTRGQTSKEIARDLNLSPRTVEDVRARLLKRFKVRNAAELLARLAGPAF
ncbi:LuxR C-terminal-related transcriptional regulator [Pseudooceanicola nitratireducens]|uniref:LuxR C-terminal-related transcriptional regulator n=1 Tax=Pseudooceanicola nitratireducens TaxID=517719 RepID=UPI0035128E2E